MPLLALGLALGVGVPAARAQTQVSLGPDIWSMQLDGGVFAPIEASGTSPTAGMRYCKHYSTHLQGGLLTGWTFKRAKLEAPVAGGPGLAVNGRTRADRREPGAADGIHAGQPHRQAPAVPYVGFGAGYEWLALHTVDHQTGAQTKVTYANLAWQGYAGLGIRFASIWRLNNELYYNGGSLERKLPDAERARAA